MERRLAAILAADVVGYSRLMGRNETGTLERLKSLRRELVQPKISEHSGRIVKVMGDGLLAEFPSVVDAVECAAEIQRVLRARDSDLPHDNRIRLRIGINLGDIIVEGTDIYGDGVNAAARLESLAEPGGICISSIVQESLGNRVSIQFADAGYHEIKNFDRPIHVWRWSSTGSEGAGADKAGPNLPDKPSIAVLPFDNMSTESDQVFFAEGLSEDLITELSKFGSLFVIARNSSFAFKGQQMEAREIGRKLGVRYVVEGSVRRAGNRVRVTAQLIDTKDDRHIWAERYDRDLEDIFAVQDEVTRSIVSAIEPQLLSSERQRALRKPVESLDAWESYQRGLWHLYQYTPEGNAEALNFLGRAVELDPTFASPRAGLAVAVVTAMSNGFPLRDEQTIVYATENARAAVKLDDTDPFAHFAVGRTCYINGEHDDALAAYDRALEINPNYAAGHFGRAQVLWMSGHPQEAIEEQDEAMRLSPRDQLMWAFLAGKAIALSLLGHHEEAVEHARQSQRFASTAIWANLAELSALGHLNRVDDARLALERAYAVKKDISLAFIDSGLKFKHAADRNKYLTGLRKAGLPL